MQKGKYPVSNIFLTGFARGRGWERETGPRRFGRAGGGEEGAREGRRGGEKRWKGVARRRSGKPGPARRGGPPELPAQLRLSMARGGGEAAGGERGALPAAPLQPLFSKSALPPLSAPFCGKKRGRGLLSQEVAPSSISCGGNSAVFPLDVLVNGRGGLFARAHGQNDGGRAGDRVAARRRRPRGR